VINIEYVDADKLQPAQYNPRTMTDDAMGRLVKLLDAHGIVDPLIARRSDNMLIGGHQRLKANSLRANPDTQVPVVYVDVNDEEAKALNIALNNTKAMGEYDNSILADLLQELDNGEIDVEAATGFAEKDIAELMHGLDEYQVTEEDETPEPPEDPVSKTGDLWMMGEHRLLCGDCCSVTPDTWDLMVTDPPYGVDYEGGAGNTEKREKIAGDGDAGLYSKMLKAWMPTRKDGAPVYLWFAGREGGPVFDAVEDAGLVIRSLIVWNKLNPHYGAFMAQYMQRHEPCLYCVKGKANWYGPTNEVSVWDIEQPHRNEHHPTQKPIECMSRAIQNSSRAGDVVAEPFSGSGTTIIACEQLKRKCYAIEIEPRYVDVAVKRWQNLTNEEATLEGDGRTFAEIETARAK